MPEYNVSKLKLPNGVVLNLSGGSTSTEWLSETTVSSGTTETNGIEYTISTTNYKDGTTDTTYNNTFTVKNGTSSRPGVVYLTSTSADSSSASGTGDKTAATPLCVYNSIHDTDNALTLQNIGTGTDDTIAYTITASRLAYAVQAHDHLVDFKPAYTNPLVYDNTNKKLTLNADMNYYYRDSTGHPGGHDLDIESTGYLEIPYGNGTNPGVLKLSSAAATSSNTSGNSDYTAATPKAVYDSIHSTSNVMPSATATAGTDTTTGYTLTAAGLKEAIETFGGTTYDAIDPDTDLWNTPYVSLSTDEKVISPKMLAYFIKGASGRSTSYRLPSNANLNDYTDCCHTYFCDINSSNMTNLPSDVSCNGLGQGNFNLIPINIGIISKGQILVAEDKDYVYFRRYRLSTGAWTTWRALGIPCTGHSALGNVYLTDNAANIYSSGAAQSVAASPTCVYNSIRSSNNAASTSDYGVTKLSTSTSSTSTTLAATPSAVKSAYDLANSANTAATTNANSSTYGRVKLSASTSSTYGTGDGYAATPSAVRSAYNLADSAYDLADSLQNSIPTHENFSVTIGNLSWSQLNGSTGWFYADISDHTYTEIYSVTLGINEKCNKNYILMPAITGTSSNTKVRLFCNADPSSLTTWKQRIHVCGIL